MKKRLLAALICFAMLLSGFTAFAETFQKAPGISEFIQALDGEYTAENAMFDGEFINIAPGGYATYEFTLPFDAM